MPIIYSYPIVNVLNGADMFVISKSPADPSIDEWETKSITAESVATYVAGKIDLNFVGDTGSGIVNLSTQSLTISGTSNEIETAASSQTLQIGLPDNVIIQNDLTVGNDIQVNNDVQIDGSLTVNNLTQTLSLQVDNDATISATLTMEDEIDMLTNRIVNLGNPINAQDAVTKSYVDTAVTGLLEFKGTFRADTGEIVIKVDSMYFRPTEVDELKGDATKAFNKLGWEPKTTLEELIEEMVTEDKKQALKEIYLKKRI